MTYKTQFKIITLVATLALIVFNAYWFGYKSLENKIYQRGISAGKNELNQQIIQQLVTQGRIGVNLPLDEQGRFDLNGTIKTIILTPAQ
jgi:hypothetical protein